MPLREYRCRRCHRLLFRSNGERGMVEAVCPDRRCKMMQTVRLEPREQEPAQVPPQVPPQVERRMLVAV